MVLWLLAKIFIDFAHVQHVQCIDNQIDINLVRVEGERERGWFTSGKEERKGEKEKRKEKGKGNATWHMASIKSIF